MIPKLSRTVQRIGLLALLLVALTAIATANDQRSVLLRNVRVFDGRRVIPSTSVLIRGERIAAINPGLPVPAGAEVIDGSGKTLLPGLIDSHGHASTLPTALRDALVFGVTTELGMFDIPELVAEVKARHQDGQEANYFSAGILATAPGGHGGCPSSRARMPRTLARLTARPCTVSWRCSSMLG